MLRCETTVSYVITEARSAVATHAGQVLGRASVGISSLNHPNFDFVVTFQLCLCDQITEEHGDHDRNLVPIQQSERALRFVQIVVHDPVGISIKGAATGTRLRQVACRLDRRRQGLLGLHEVRAALRIEGPRGSCGCVDRMDRYDVAEVFGDLREGGGTNSIRTVDI